MFFRRTWISAVKNDLEFPNLPEMFKILMQTNALYSFRYIDHIKLLITNTKCEIPFNAYCVQELRREKNFDVNCLCYL